MTPIRMPYGFRVVGDATGRRRLVDAGAAIVAYADLDPRAEPEREGYLSAFTFGGEFRRHLDETGSTRGYAGPCWAPFLWFDLDADDLGQAFDRARRLAMFILHRYTSLDDDDLLCFFSGARGAHIGLPTFWGPPPSDTFHHTARRFAERMASAAGVSIDTGVYDRVRLFRAPNSRHPRTGLHKRRLMLDELLHLDADRIRQLAVAPIPFDLPVISESCDQAAADWRDAAAAVEQEAEVAAARRAAVANGDARLTRVTLAFIRDGADQGDRHRLLFSAAANLAEFGCPAALAHALLTEAALDSGLTPADVRRQIECGLAHVAKGAGNA